MSAHNLGHHGNKFSEAHWAGNVTQLRTSFTLDSTQTSTTAGNADLNSYQAQLCEVGLSRMY